MTPVAVLAVSAVLATGVACGGESEEERLLRLVRHAPAAARAAGGATYTFAFEADTGEGRNRLSGSGRVHFASDTSAMRVSFGEFGARRGVTGEYDVVTRGTRYWLRLPRDRQRGAYPRPWVATDVTQASVAMSTFMHAPYALDMLGAASDVTDRGREDVGGVSARRLSVVVWTRDVYGRLPMTMRDATRESQRQIGLERLDLDVWVDGEGRPVRVDTREHGRSDGVRATFTLAYEAVAPVDLPPPASTTEVSDLSRVNDAIGFGTVRP